MIDKDGWKEKRQDGCMTREVTGSPATKTGYRKIILRVIFLKIGARTLTQS